MKLQIALRAENPSLEFLRVSNPAIFEPFDSWSELEVKFELKKLDNDCYLLTAEIQDSSFEALSQIFGSKENALGAFLTLAVERGWEEFPSNILFLHIWEENGMTIASVYSQGELELFKHDNLEALSRKLASANRVVVFSMDIVAKVRDVFPGLEGKTYSISRHLSAKELENNSLKDFLGDSVQEKDIPKYLKDLTNSLVSKGLIKPVWLPIKDCSQLD
ncbi:MAG: hypothetical protein ABDH18_05430 [Aquificaceae bacterium]